MRKEAGGWKARWKARLGAGKGQGELKQTYGGNDGATGFSLPVGVHHRAALGAHNLRATHGEEKATCLSPTAQNTGTVGIQKII